MANAVMTVTPIRSAASTTGDVRRIPVEMTFTAVGDTYVTGGFTVDPRSCGLLEVLGMDVISFGLTTGAAQTGSWLVEYDHQTKKLQLFTAAAAPGTTTALVEAGAAVVVGTFIIRAEVIGRG